MFLAPMEDVSDPPFRLLCKRYGADLLYTEFVSSGGLVFQANDSLKKLEFHDEERPLAIQIFGGEVEQVREATSIVDQVEPDIIDINFGCPVRKVVCQDAGAGILRNLPKMQALTEAVLASTSRPVTVKTRLGWSDDTIQILDVIHMLQDAGVQAVAVHARTRSQMYKGTARWDWLRRIKEDRSIRVPIIGNGDAMSPVRIKAMFEETGVDAVMIGRGAIGNPWIFRDTRQFLLEGKLPSTPGWNERLSVVAEHLTLKCEWLGERRGVLEMRRMYGGYFRDFPGSGRLRQLLFQQEDRDSVLEVLRSISHVELDAGTGLPISEPALVGACD